VCSTQALREQKRERFQDGDYREEAESMLPKVKSWRDAGEHLAGKTTKKR
jgi:hypothetical protein